MESEPYSYVSLIKIQLIIKTILKRIYLKVLGVL